MGLVEVKSTFTRDEARKIGAAVFHELTGRPWTRAYGQTNRVLQGLKYLKQRDAQMLRLRFIEGKTFSEIGLQRYKISDATRGFWGAISPAGARLACKRAVCRLGEFWSY